jgi:hypothetical protein
MFKELRSKLIFKKICKLQQNLVILRRDLYNAQDNRYNTDLEEHTEIYLGHLDNKIDDLNDEISIVINKLEKLKDKYSKLKD